MENIFQQEITSVFIEGTTDPISSSITNSASIDTTSIDAFRQGVEIRNQSQFDAGSLKIWSGEPGHVVPSLTVGEDPNFDLGTYDDVSFDPVTFLRAQESRSYLFTYGPHGDGLITFPILVGDNDQVENATLNGALEPFPIREVVGFFSIDIPFQARTVRASLMDGNEDSLGSNDSIKSIDKFEPTKHKPGFLDMIDMIGPLSTVAFINDEVVVQTPFLDARYLRNVNTSSSTYGSTMAAALSLMTGSTDNYVSFDDVAQSTGWEFDGQHVDSIAFGGMTFK